MASYLEIYFCRVFYRRTGIVDCFVTICRLHNGTAWFFKGRNQIMNIRVYKSREGDERVETFIYEQVYLIIISYVKLCSKIDTHLSRSNNTYHLVLMIPIIEGAILSVSIRKVGKFVK